MSILDDAFKQIPFQTITYFQFGGTYLNETHALI